MFDAVKVALTEVTHNAGDGVSFQYGSDTYIVTDNGAANTFDTGDGVVKLTGINETDLSSSNVVGHT